MSTIRRRDFIAGLGSTAAWPLAARAQQPALPVVGFLYSASPQGRGSLIARFLGGLAETGYVPGRNVAIDYRWAEYQNDLLPSLAIELVGRKPNVIAVGPSSNAVFAVRKASESIPTVFHIGGDPVRNGLVASFARPGGNITGVTVISTQLSAKRLELLHELVPTTNTIALLVNETTPSAARGDMRETQGSADALGMRLLVLNASSPSDIEPAFINAKRLGAGALLLGTDTLFNGQRNQIIAMAARHTMPTMYQNRASALAGGLISYAADDGELQHQWGVYTGRVLRGESPADLPVHQPTKFQLVINLKTAKTLGLTVPLALLFFANEQID